MWLDSTYTCTETETETVGGSRGIKGSRGIEVAGVVKY